MDAPAEKNMLHRRCRTI